MRRDQRWNLRDSVEERKPMLLLGRPLGASAARVGGLLSTGRVGAHGSAAAAVSSRGPFLSYPFPHRIQTNNSSYALPLTARVDGMNRRRHYLKS